MSTDSLKGFAQDLMWNCIPRATSTKKKTDVGQVRCPDKNKPINFRPRTQNHVSRSRHWQQVISARTHTKQVNYDPHTKPKSISMHTLKSSPFRPAHNNRVSLHTRHKDEVNFYLHSKPKPFTIPHSKTKVNFDPTLTSNQSQSPL